jgi:hypothetical protein
MKLLIVNIPPSLFEAPEEVLAMPIGLRNDEKKTPVSVSLHHYEGVNDRNNLITD